MRALLIEAPSGRADTTALHQLPIPEPGPEDVTIDVAYAGINFMDVMARRGDAGYAPRWPYAPGMEVSGTIRAVGENVVGLSCGQRVAALTPGGGYADVVRVPATLTVPLPDAIDLDVAAAVPLTLSTALLLITDAAHVQPGDAVLVHAAAGGVGRALAQLLPLFGCTLRLGTVGQAAKRTAAREAGYDEVVAREDGDFQAFMQRAPQGCQVILDPLGTSLLETDLRLAAPGARIVLFGNAAGQPFGPLPPAAQLLAGNASIGGFSLRGWAARAPHRVRWAMQQGLEHLVSGRVQWPRPAVVELPNVAEVHQLMASGRSTGKFVAQIAP